MIVPPRERRGLAGRPRQHVEEAREHLRPESCIGRQLPQDRPELCPQPQHARAEVIRERRLDLAELQHMRDVAAALEREDEILGRLAMPLLEQLRSLQRVKGAVDLDAVEPLRGVSELIPLPQSLRIEHAPPAAVAPARDADLDLAEGHAEMNARLAFEFPRPLAPAPGEAACFCASTVAYRLPPGFFFGRDGSVCTVAPSPRLWRSAALRLAGRPCLRRRSRKASSASSWNVIMRSRPRRSRAAQVSSSIWMRLPGIGA